MKYKQQDHKQHYRSTGKKIQSIWQNIYFKPQYKILIKSK